MYMTDNTEVDVQTQVGFKERTRGQVLSVHGGPVWKKP